MRLTAHTIDRIDEGGNRRQDKTREWREWLKARDLVIEGGSPQSPLVEVEGEMMCTKLRDAVGIVEKRKSSRRTQRWKNDASR